MPRSHRPTNSAGRKSDGLTDTDLPVQGSKAWAEPRFLHKLTAENFLSFGPQTELWLQNLNVLIGPNGSGKSNLLEMIAVLRSAPTDFRPVILKGGGVAEWIWKGQPGSSAWIRAIVRDSAKLPVRIGKPLRHAITFRVDEQTFRLVDERLEGAYPNPDGERFLVYEFRGGSPAINVRGKMRPLKNFEADLSILAQRRDADAYPEMTRLSENYDRIRLYREWAFGRNTVFRQPQKADARNDRLEEDFSNLGLFLNRLRRHPKAKQDVLTGLRNLYEGLSDFDVSVEGGTVQVFFVEGDFTVPAKRLSDGSLRYLCLLAILCDPDPPPLIGIEEPELGMHPDLISKLADLLVSASTRCQLIVTTHSDILVDALSEHPGSVVVCEKHEGKTRFRRLDPDELAPWLQKYRLGQLWTRGEIGGTRW